MGDGFHLGGEVTVSQEAVQVGDAGENDGDGVVAFPLGTGTETVAGHQGL